MLIGRIVRQPVKLSVETPICITYSVLITIRIYRSSPLPEDWRLLIVLLDQTNNKNSYHRYDLDPNRTQRFDGCFCRFLDLQYTHIQKFFYFSPYGKSLKEVNLMDVFSAVALEIMMQATVNLITALEPFDSWVKSLRVFIHAPV